MTGDYDPFESEKRDLQALLMVAEMTLRALDGCVPDGITGQVLDVVERIEAASRRLDEEAAAEKLRPRQSHLQLVAPQ